MSLPCSRELLEALVRSLDEVRAAWQAYRRAPGEPTLHDFRTAVRQTRVLLRQGVFPESAAACGDSLKSLARQLAPARDLDVTAAFLDRWEIHGSASSRTALLRLRRRVADRRRRAHRQVTAYLNGEASAEHVRRLETALRSLKRSLPMAPPESRAQSVRGLIDANLQKIRRKRRLAESKREEDLHELRIQIRHLRYLHDLLPDRFSEPEHDLYRDLRQGERRLGKLHDHDLILDLLDHEEDPALAPLIRAVRKERSKRLRRFREVWKKLPKAYR